MQKKILITGASGFIGTNLIKFLKNKNCFDIYAIENKKKIKLPNKKKLFSSLNNVNKIYKYIKIIKPDILIHLAWSKIPDFSKNNNKNNFNNQKKFLKMLKKTDLKKIFIAGTCYEYGSIFGQTIENIKIKNIKSIGYYKDKLRKYCYKILSKKKIVWGRIFYVYGEGQRKNSLIKQLSQKKKIYIKEPYTFCDFINIYDVCSAIYLLINSNYNKIVNISNNKPHSVLEFCLIVKKYLNRNILLDINQNSKIKGNWGDNSILRKLGWRSNYNLINGIKKTLNEKN